VHIYSACNEEFQAFCLQTIHMMCACGLQICAVLEGVEERETAIHAQLYRHASVILLPLSRQLLG
jgi:hypothetical protein